MTNQSPEYSDSLPVVPMEKLKPFRVPGMENKTINPSVRLLWNGTFGAKQKKPHPIVYTSRMWGMYMQGSITICDFFLQPNVIKNVAFMKNKMTERLNSIWVFRRDWYRVMDSRNGDFLNGKFGRQQMQYHFLKQWIEHLSNGDSKVMGTARSLHYPLGGVMSPGLYWEPPPSKKLPNDLGGYKRGELIVHGALQSRRQSEWDLGRHLSMPVTVFKGSEDRNG